MLYIFYMKKNILIFLVFSWIFVFINTASASVKKHQGKGELHLSNELIDQYFNYVTKPLNKLPLVFFITEDQKNFFLTIIDNDGGGYAGSGTISKKKRRCENKFKQKCNLFSNSRYIVWDNGINPLNEKDSKISYKISKAELILKLKELGFITDAKQLAVKKEKKLAKEKAAKEKAAKEKKLAEEKAAKEKKLAEEKAAKEKKLAEEKAAKEKKLAEEKAAEEKAAEEKLKKKISLMPAETNLIKAQNFLNNLQQFIKYFPDVFDIVKVSEFFILTKPILDGEINYKLEEDLNLFKEFTSKSEKFVNYIEDIEKNTKFKKLKKIDQAFNNLETNIKIIKGFMIEYPNSLKLELWLTNIKIANEVLDNPSSYEQLLSINNNLSELIIKKDELDDASKELKLIINELKDHLKENLTTDLAPLLIEQIKILEKTLKKEITEAIISANQAAKDFIFKKIEQPKIKAAEEKRLAEEKAAEEKRLAEEKARQEYLKTPEGQKEEKERIKKEKERLAEEKRLKNFKPITMNCTYSGVGGVENYNWVYDGKKLNWQGFQMDIPSETDDGIGTKISVKKMEGRDKFKVEIVAGFIPISFTVDFGGRSSTMDTMGMKIYGTCF